VEKREKIKKGTNLGDSGVNAEMAKNPKIPTGLINGTYWIEGKGKGGSKPVRGIDFLSNVRNNRGVIAKRTEKNDTNRI